MTFKRCFGTMMARMIVSLVLVTGFGAAAWAVDLVVLEARGIALRPGQTIDSTQSLSLKQGQHVTLISPTGTTLKLDGPYDKAPGGDVGRGMSVTNALSLLVTQRQARVGEVGTTRGAAPGVLPEPWVLDASRTGIVCLRDDQRAVLWRPDTTRDAELTVAPTDRSWKTSAHWGSGTDRIMVEAPAVIRGGATYLVTLDGVQSAMKVESVPATLANDSVSAAWLAGKGCEAQARALLRSGR